MSARPAHRTIRGRLLYTSRQPGREGRERGREFFALTVHADGARTLHAHCEIDDAPAVIRDVTLALGAHGRPTDAAVRLSVGDRFVGSAWFRFGARELECEAYTALEGRVSQRAAVAAPIGMFGTHPIQADSLLVALADRALGPRPQGFPELWMCSLDHRGATGPLLMRHPTGLRLAFLGEERVKVAAGEFDAWRFAIGDDAARDAADGETRNEPGRHPPYELWCTADGDFVVLKAQVSGYMMTAYELVELERS